MTDRNREIVRLHIEEGLNLSDVGKRFDLTRERVRQIVAASGAPSLTRTRWQEQREIRNIFYAVVITAKHTHTQRHGTRYRYMLGCSCSECRAANNRYTRALREKSSPPNHGHSGYVNYGCRCDVCTKAEREYRRGLRGASVWPQVQEAVNAGRLVKPDVCQDCGENPGRLHGHHEDYSKPLDVEWLCPSCHARRHTPVRVSGRVRTPA